MNTVFPNLLQILLWIPVGLGILSTIPFLGTLTASGLLRRQDEPDEDFYFLVGLATLGSIVLLLTFLAMHVAFFAHTMSYIGFGLLLIGLRNFFLRHHSPPLKLSVWLYVASYLILMLFQFGTVEAFGPDTPANNFQRNLPIDYKISLMFAESLRAGDLLTFGDWLGSDRPPLMSGFILFFKLPGLNLDQSYLFVGTWMQLLIVPTAIVTLRIMLKGQAENVAASATIIFLMALSPLFIHNISFLWPKILASAFFLAATALLLFRISDEIATATIGGILLALAFLAHGGIAFAIIGLGLVYILSQLSIHGIFRGVITFITFLIFYLPWAHYKAAVQPPGDRLLKWHLLDHIPVTDQSFFEVAAEKYQGFDLSDLMKRLRVSLDHQFHAPLERVMRNESDFHFGELLIEQSFYSTIGSVGFLTLPICLLIALCVRNRAIGISTLLWFFCFASWSLLSFKGAINVHEGAYAVQVLPWLIMAYGVQVMTSHSLRKCILALLIVQTVATMWFFWDARADRLRVGGKLVSIHRDMIGTDFSNTKFAGWQIVGSWGPNGNADTAELIIELMSPDRIMYITGPDATGQELVIKIGSQTVTRVSEEFYASWSYIDMPEAGLVTISLTDIGTSWGQWSAVAVPAAPIDQP